MFCFAKIYFCCVLLRYFRKILRHGKIKKIRNFFVVILIKSFKIIPVILRQTIKNCLNDDKYDEKSSCQNCLDFSARMRKQAQNKSKLYRNSTASNVARKTKRKCCEKRKNGWAFLRFVLTLFSYIPSESCYGNI